MVVSGTPLVERRQRVASRYRSVDRLPLLVLLFPLSVVVASMFVSPGSTQQRQTEISAIDQPVVSKPFDFSSADAAVTIDTIFQPPSQTLVFLSTALIDSRGEVVFQYDTEGKGSNAPPTETAPSSSTSAPPTLVGWPNQHSIRFRPDSIGAYRLRYEAYLPRDIKGEATTMSGALLVQSTITTAPVNIGILLLTVFASSCAALMYLSRVYGHGRLRCSGSFASEGQAGRATRGDYAAGLISMHCIARFDSGWDTDLQSRTLAVGIRVTNGSGHLLYRGSAPVISVSNSDHSGTMTLKLQPQLFELTKDTNLRFDVRLPESTSNLDLESVQILVSDQVVVPWRKEAVKLDP